VTQSVTASRPSNAAPGAAGIFSRRKNLACVLFHKRELGIEDSRPLESFLRLVEGSEGCTAESSCRVEARQQHAARWNLFYHGDNRAEFLGGVWGFLEEVARSTGAPLDYGLLREFLGEGFQLDRLRKVVTGIDLRKKPGASRLKVWFMLRDYAEKVEHAIALHGEDAGVRRLIFHDEFLVGFDFRFDGGCAVKLYPDVRPAEIKDPVVRETVRSALSGEAVDAMERCLWTHIYIARHNSGIVLQCHPAEPDLFIDRYLDQELAGPIHGLYSGTGLLDMVVSFRLGDLGRRPIQDFAVYYMPQEEPRSPVDPAIT
jgi:LynF/TruF/PatF family peptide O-prenyltransferase